MQISGVEMIFIFGCAGGALLELLRWWKLRESDEFPAFVRKPSYWILTFAMVVVGGAVAVVYGGDGTTNAIQAMNLGAAAPAIVGALAKEPRSTSSQQTKKFDGSPSDNRRRLRRFLAFG